jgi:hypothetical protein
VDRALRVVGPADGRSRRVGLAFGPHVWQAFAVLLPLCALVLLWATSVFRKAIT